MRDFTSFIFFGGWMLITPSTNSGIGLIPFELMSLPIKGTSCFKKLEYYSMIIYELVESSSHNRDIIYINFTQFSVHLDCF